jgi:WD40 repeat protein
VLLPANSFPLTFSGHLVVCELLSPTGMQTTRLVVYDTARRQVVRDLGPAVSFTASHGVLLWTSQPCSAATDCPLHSYDVRTGIGTERGYALPVEAGVTGGVLSPDGRRLAFQLPRMSSDPRYSTQLPGSPSDLVVLDLATGVLDPVPNLELPPGSVAGMTFSADSRWLVTAVTGSHGPQLLLWRSGLTQPLASTVRLPGPMGDPVPFLTQPADRS